MLLFLYNIDPVIVYLEKRLTGVLLYKYPVAGPTLPNQEALPALEDKYTIKGYADDLKPVIKSMAEFVMIDKVVGVFESASGCAIHRDPTQDKCKVLLLGGWKRLQQDDIPINYIRISDHLDMLGFTLMATFTKTRKANGDAVQSKFRSTIGPWRAGRFMALTLRSPSLNTYALPKIWFKSHSMEYRAGDVSFFNKQMQSWLFADMLEKPTDLVKYRSANEGGLSLHHIKTKCTAILIKSFMETSCNVKFAHSQYHQALLEWNVHNKRDIPEPIQSPYYTQEMYNIIQSAISKNMLVGTMLTKDWYDFILSSLLYEPGTESLIPCRVEIRNPLNDWSKSWSLARLKGLSSDSSTFLWQLLHQLLLVRERLERFLPNVNSSACQACDTGAVDTLSHALVTCPSSSEVFNWMLDGLKEFTTDLTAEKVLLLDFTASGHLPHEDLPLVWFTAEVLQRLWRRRRDGRVCRLYEVRAELEAAVNMVRRSQYSDIAVILDLMLIDRQ